MSWRQVLNQKENVFRWQPQMKMESRGEGKKGSMGMWFCAQCQLKPGLKPSGLGLFCRAGFFSDVSTALRLCFECQIFHSWPCSQLLWVSTHSLGLRKLERSKYICPRVLTGILGPVSASTLICFLIMILVIYSCFSDLFLHLQFEGIFILHTKC